MILLMIGLMLCMLLAAMPPGATIEGAGTIEGSMNALRNPGAPVAGTNEVQTLTIGGAPTAGPTSGIQFTYQGLTSALALWSATNATLVAAIQAVLDTMFGSGTTVVAVGTMTAGVGTITITFSGAALLKRNLGAAMGVINSLTGAAPTASVARTTPGVDATFRGASAGQMLIDITNDKAYINTGTAGNPTWTVVGTQS